MYMAKPQLKFKLSDTQRDYVKSDAVVNAIISNTGEGKTYASVVAMVYHAMRCGKDIRAAIVRDTHENIKNSTVRSIQQVFEEMPWMIEFKNDFKQLTIKTNPKVEADLFGIADPGALGKLQGPEYAFIWLEEPAAMSDKANAGLSEEVFNAALVRCARQKGTKPRLQISMNPADQEHWTYKRLVESEYIDPDNPLITKRVWFVPYGDNPHVSPESRQAVKAAYKDDPQAYMRYVLGQFAPVYMGKKVTPEYNPLIHQSMVPLTPARGLVSFRLWDGWHNPACILGQITTIGRLIFHDVILLEGGDIKTLIETRVKPLMNSPRWLDKAKGWRDIGDFSMRQPDQSNRQRCAAQVVEELLGTLFESGPHRWELIRDGARRALNKMISGHPAILLDPTHCKLLHKGLSGAWHFKTNNAGHITQKIPAKNDVSHVCDAWANGVSVLLPALDTTGLVEKYRGLQSKARNLANSYVTRG